MLPVSGVILVELDGDSVVLVLVIVGRGCTTESSLPLSVVVSRFRDTTEDAVGWIRARKGIEVFPSSRAKSRTERGQSSARGGDGNKDGPSARAPTVQQIPRRNGDGDGMWTDSTDAGRSVPANRSGLRRSGGRRSRWMEVAGMTGVGGLRHQAAAKAKPGGCGTHIKGAHEGTDATLAQKLPARAGSC